MFISWKDSNGSERAINLNSVSKMMFTRKDSGKNDSQRACLEIEARGESRDKATLIQGSQAESIWRQLMMTQEFI